ncbi:MAG: 3-dehydroquinate synthase [Verrucomicrobia bacterium]|nr:MAG: 3-dehydroquinate synthase [Verrucomicrobiota bacterium]
MSPLNSAPSFRSTDKPPPPLSLEEAVKLAHETRHIEAGERVLCKAPDLFRQFFGEKPALIVADPNTFAAAGQGVLESLRHSGTPTRESLFFTDPNLYAEHSFVAELESALKDTDAIPIAVGSGTINDITKLAAHRTGRSYMAVATAASMDGYTAYGASISYQGSKQTFPCPAPIAVLADIEVIAAAPPELAASGYADLLAKVTAGADWLLADALGVEPIDQTAWLLAQGHLRDAVSNPPGVRERDRESIRQLTEALMFGGLAMQWNKSSRSASGAEHQFSHLWDMTFHHKELNELNGLNKLNGENSEPGVARGPETKAPSHGFKVGIGTLAVAALYEYLLERDLVGLNIKDCVAQWPDQHALQNRVTTLFSDNLLADIALTETRAKWISPEALRGQLERLRQVWPELRERLRQQLMPYSTLKRMLRDAGAPVEPEQIGITRERFRQSFRQAALIRRRFTVLDLAVRTGLLEPALDHLFGPVGPWPIS